MSQLSPTVEVERSVHDMLYGSRTEVRAVPCPSGSVGRLAGGRYRLLEQIGAGGMGTVYRARDERLKREVAVKLITERLARDARSVEHLRVEPRSERDLPTRTIVAVLYSGRQPRDFIVMEHVDGLDIAKLVRRQGPLAVGEVVHLVAQICDALTHAHMRNVVHGDVSRRNILVDLPQLTAKLIAFGVASDTQAAPAGPTADAAGAPGYVAPEVVGGAPPSPRADLYSVGCVSHTGCWPGRRPTIPRPTEPLPTASPRLPSLAAIRPSLPPRLCEAVDQACAPEPRERQEVAEFRAQLMGAREATVVPLAAAA